MKALVTGATGFVGSHLAEALVHAGHKVKTLARHASDTALLETLGVAIVRGDLTDSAAVEEAVKGCEQVYHLAAKTGRLASSRKEYAAVNIAGTENVVRAARKANVERLVYVSTVGIYGTLTGSPADEQTQPNPNTYYRASKLSGEKVVLASHQTEGLPVVIARIGGVVGPRSLSWLGLFQAIATGRFRLIGAGDNHLSLCHVADIVDGLRRCGQVQGIAGASYIVTGKEPMRLAQLVHIVAQELGVSGARGTMPVEPFRVFYALGQAIYKRFGVELPYAHRYEFFLKDDVFNIAKAQKELAYAPKILVQEGIQQTVQWYREKGYL